MLYAWSQSYPWRRACLQIQGILMLGQRHWHVQNTCWTWRLSFESGRAWSGLLSATPSVHMAWGQVLSGWESILELWWLETPSEIPPEGSDVTLPHQTPFLSWLRIMWIKDYVFFHLVLMANWSVMHSLETLMFLDGPQICFNFF